MDSEWREAHINYSIFLLVHGMGGFFFLFYLSRGEGWGLLHIRFAQEWEEEWIRRWRSDKGGCCDLNTQYCSSIALVRVN